MCLETISTGRLTIRKTWHDINRAADNIYSTIPTPSTWYFIVMNLYPLLSHTQKVRSSLIRHLLQFAQALTLCLDMCCEPVTYNVRRPLHCGCFECHSVVAHHRFNQTCPVPRGACRGMWQSDQTQVSVITGAIHAKNGTVALYRPLYGPTSHKWFEGLRTIRQL